MAVAQSFTDGNGKIITLTTPVDKMPSEGGITLGERLHEIEEKLDHALDTRANKVEVDNLKQRITTIEFTLARFPDLAAFLNVISDVRDLKRDSVTRNETRKWHFGLLLAILLAFIPVLIALLGSHLKIT